MLRIFARFALLLFLVASYLPVVLAGEEDDTRINASIKELLEEDGKDRERRISELIAGGHGQAAVRYFLSLAAFIREKNDPQGADLLAQAQALITRFHYQMILGSPAPENAVDRATAIAEHVIRKVLANDVAKLVEKPNPGKVPDAKLESGIKALAMAAASNEVDAPELLRRIEKLRLDAQSTVTQSIAENAIKEIERRLAARMAAAHGRNQDITRLTPAGAIEFTPELDALIFSLQKRMGGRILWCPTDLVPSVIADPLPNPLPPRVQEILKATPPVNMLKPAKKWGTGVQAAFKSTFETNHGEAIPFVANFPKLDGDLTDWNDVRPLKIGGAADPRPIHVLMAWNYQGIFLGYRVHQKPNEPLPPNDPIEKTGGKEFIRMRKDGSIHGDHFRLLFDMLDSRKNPPDCRCAQELSLFPFGTRSNPEIPGAEVVTRPNEAGVQESICVLFSKQPSPEKGPDGSGPYRITRMNDDGYSVEVFIPRSLFKWPVFVPGWYIGFDCAAGPRSWAGGKSTDPGQWGDILLLGTDARFICQDGDAKGTVTQFLVPGASYLLTVIDPDRNVSVNAVDKIVVTAEVEEDGGEAEIFVLSETANNTSIFRGYVETMPTRMRRIPGVLEMDAGQMIRFRYLDVGDSTGAPASLEMKFPIISAELLKDREK